ncbi:MAG: FAD-dependent oxidoreductase [Desulfobacteraceae bacterium]|nr:FAD-dependent oxidoreductase [Desulfobacteraceae bacterium]
MGNFIARIHRLPRYVDESVCTACGTCANYCPVPINDAYNEGLKLTKALHIDYQQAIPASYHIDANACLFLTRQECKQCERACFAKAIDFKQQPQDIDLNVGAVILSPGFGRIDKSVLSRYGYGLSPDVITGMELERLTSASGPTMGEIVRPSDGKHPKCIAFLQCIGSRDLPSGNGYCSSVCCMYAIKEALVAKDHAPDLDITVFYMDMRTQGKEFDYARIRAREKGIRFVRSRGGLSCNKDKNLEVSYINDRGEHVSEPFDMIILPEGLESPEDSKSLAEASGIDLNQYDFCSTRSYAPLEATRKGIYVAGAFQGPKDVPESVTDASGAAALAVEVLQEARGTRVEMMTYPEEIKIEAEPRIGVFVCSCGSNIGGVVDVQAVARHAEIYENVVFTDTNLYSCAQNTQEAITEKIKVNRLNRVVVAACTPRTHEPLFQETLRNAGLNPSLFEMANIRDHCSWVHANTPEGATEKSMDLVKMAVAKARLLKPLREQKLPVIPKALVIGGGISGMTAALSIARQGFECFLVERSKELGGNLKHLRYTLTGDDPNRILQNLETNVRSNQLIHIYTDAHIENISGYIGNFTTTLRVLGETEALEHGVVVLATGGIPYEPKQYLYGKSEKVVTQLEFEQQLASDSIDKGPQNIVMIQCVGSRGEDLSYCSKVCCSQAVKNALKVLELNPEASITILYRDMRTYGFMEDYYQLAREKEVNFIQFDKDSSPGVTEENGHIKVDFFDRVLGERVSLEPDLLVLSVGIVSRQVQELAKMLKTPLTQDNFFLEAHPKLRPVELSVDGIYVCGIAHSPKPIPESIAQAKAAAGKACIPLAKEFVRVDPIVSSIDQDACIGCGICEKLCPYAAIRMTKIGKKKKAETISASCKGCGVCASHCPAFAISMAGFTNDQIIAQIEAFGEDMLDGS